MKALVTFSTGKRSLVKVNSSYSCGGVHYYNLTTNALDSFLDFAPGETNTLIYGQDVTSLTYVMG